MQEEKYGVCLLLLALPSTPPYMPAHHTHTHTRTHTHHTRAVEVLVVQSKVKAQKQLEGSL